MSGSKLTSLLQYRFVKKDQKSPPSSQSSGSVTVSPSQTSTQPPVTPDKSTTSSQRTPSSPGSPIFGTKPKLPGRNLISSPSQPSSSSSSPWLSKENGVMHNGNTNNNKPRRSLPSFPDQEVDFNRLFSIKDYEGKLSSLRQMFPSKEESVIQQGLIDGSGDVENAIDIIIGLKSRLKVNSNKLFSIKDYEGKLSRLRQLFPSKEESVIQQGLIDGSGDEENAIDIIIGLKSRLKVNSNKLFSIKNYEGKLSSLRQMFPSKEESVIQQGLIDGSGDVENAIDIIIGLKNKGSFKRIITDNHDSTSDPDTPIQPRKRIRTISSDSDEALDSQQTVSYGLESQRSDATEFYDLTQDDEGEEEELTDEMEKKVKFLSDCFKDKSRKQIVQALSRNGWVVADATGALSEDISLKSVTSSENRAKPKVTKPSKPAKDIVALDDDDDEEDDYGGESDDSIEEESNDAKSVILSFFDDASFEELIVMPGCSKKKAEMIVSQRPFKTWETMTEKFTTVKGLSYDLISSCREVIKIREVITRLMQRCEKITSSMGETVSNLIHSNTQLDDANHITKQPSNLNPDLQLKPFQMVGLNWLRLMHTEELNGILADEMGLGKTIQAISFLAHLLSEDEVGPHVIIVPSSTIDNWIREAKRWCPSLKVLVYYGSQEDRRSTRQYILQNTDEFHVIITTYNMVTGSLEDRSLFKKFEFHYAIFDEGHLLKNMSSLRYQNLMRISAQRRLLLTGTPLQNNLLELMSLLCFVMPDMFIGKTEQLKRMFTMITKTGGDEKRSSYEQERIAHAKRIMRPFVLRRLKSEVMSQLPKKSEQLEYCTMIPSQQEVYDKLITRFSSQIEQSYTSGGAGMLMHLRKAANHPLLHRNIYDNDKLNEMAEVLAQEPSHRERGAVPKLISEDMQVMSDFEIHNTCKYYRSCLAGFLLDESLVEESGKFRLLDDLLEKHKERGDRVLLFSQFTSMMDIMEIYLKRKKYKFIRLDGSTPVPDRQKLIDDYNNDKSIFIFILSTKAGGLGINLTSANVVILHDIDFNPYNDKQAEDRCHRVGQTSEQKLIDDYNNDKSIFIFILSTKAGGLGINLTSANVVILHDIDFNPYNDKQAEDRCHRVGQTREVQIVRLISKDTVEEAMLKCAQEKLKLEQDVISTDIKDEETGNMKDVASILKQALAHDTKKKS